MFDVSAGSKALSAAFDGNPNLAKALYGPPQPDTSSGAIRTSRVCSAHPRPTTRPPFTSVCYFNTYHNLHTALGNRTEAGRDIPSILRCSTVAAGLRARIDPSQIPSPIDSIEADKEMWEKQMHTTLPGHSPPLSTTDFVAIDQGELSIKQFRVRNWSSASEHLVFFFSLPLQA